MSAKASVPPVRPFGREQALVLRLEHPLLHLVWSRQRVCLPL